MSLAKFFEQVFGSSEIQQGNVLAHGWRPDLHYLIMSRGVTEAVFYDRKASQIAVENFRSEHFLRVCCYPQLLQKLAPLQDKRVCDFGCGDGKLAVTLALRGARVDAFDISSEYIRLAEQYAALNQVEVQFSVMNAEQTQYPSNSFDFVVGNAIVHHLNVPRAAEEVRRILKPGGRAYFWEPSAGNPLLQFARLHLPYPHKDRTPDEAPLTTSSLELFDGVEHRELLESACRLLPAHKTPALMAFERPLRDALCMVDHTIFALFPPLKRLGRMVLVELQKPTA